GKSLSLSAGEVFTCGLLHDVGKLALAVMLPKSYLRAAERYSRQQMEICDAEREVFGVDHTVAGKRLATRWRLHAAVAECIWFHHQGSGMLPRTVKFTDAIQVLQLANAAMNRAGFAMSNAGTPPDLEAPCRALGIDVDKTDAIVAAAIQRLRPLCE